MYVRQIPGPGKPPVVARLPPLLEALRFASHPHEWFALFTGTLARVTSAAIVAGFSPTGQVADLNGYEEVSAAAEVSAAPTAWASCPALN